MQESTSTLIIFIIILLLYSCNGSPPELNFLVNSRDVSTSEQEPTDSLLWYQTFAGFKLSFKDISASAEKTKSRTWLIDGKSQSDGGPYVTHTIDAPGMHSIKLCVNEMKFCVTKWVRVLPIANPEPLPIESEPAPVVKLISPVRNRAVVNERAYNLVLSVQNVQNQDSIQLLLNDKLQSFEFDPSNGTLEKNLLLRKGDNNIELLVRAGGQDVTEFITIERSNPPSAASGSRPDKPAPQPTVELVSPSSNSITEEKTQLVSFKASNIIGGKRGIKVFVNEQEVDNTNLERDQKQKLWTIEVPLNPGKNIVEVNVNRAKAQLTIERINNEPGSSLGTAGSAYSSYDGICADLAGGNYTFQITPEKPIELLSFVLNTHECGGIRIRMTSPRGEDEITKALVRGKNQIDFDMDAVLEPGLTYTISCETYTGHPSCSATTLPEFRDASTCELSEHPNTSFALETKGRHIIFDLKYLY